MSKIEARVIADSKMDKGHRLTTMIVTFPRFILAELNTHRLFSRNSASSRAIPFKKMVESVRENPFIPIAWQKDHSGMQGTEYFTEFEKIEELNAKWLGSALDAISYATELHDKGVTKQLCNRLLEPFMWHTVLVTSSEWENFFKLRCPQYTTPVGGKDENGNDWVYRSRKDVIAGHSNPDNLDMMSKFTELDWLKHNKGQAEIHMMALAEAMWDAYNESTPKELKAGEYHIPFGDNISVDILNIQRQQSYQMSLDEIRIRIAVARCARVSYTVVGEEGKTANYENDIKLFDRLLKSGHMSPFEHVGRAMTDKEYDNHIQGVGYDFGGTFSQKEFDQKDYGWSGNFRGFIQYRKTIE